MPKKRRDLTGTIITKKANQTNKKIIVQLNNKERKDKEEYNRLKSEFVRNDNKYTKNESKEIQARVKEKIVRDSERYILQIFLLQ